MTTLVTYRKVTNPVPQVSSGKSITSSLGSSLEKNVSNFRLFLTVFPSLGERSLTSRGYHTITNFSVKGPLSGRDFGLVSGRLADYGLACELATHARSPRVKRGISGSRNLRFISAIRADSGRFSGERRGVGGMTQTWSPHDPQPD